MKSFLWMLTAAIVWSVPSLALADYQDGRDAFDRGDYQTAFKEFRAEAERGDVRGQYALGLMYDLGEGIPENYEEAVKWYRLAAEQGNADARNNLATMYAEGEGVAKDYGQAMKWYRLAAEEGNFDAPNNIGAMYMHGTGVSRDYVKAYMWFHLGEMKGDREAVNNRKFVQKKLTPDEISEANKLVGEWIKTYAR